MALTSINDWSYDFLYRTVSSKAIRHYLDILQDTFMVRQLQPYYANTKKRIVKSPKVYLRDSGILHFLLKIYDMEDLYANPIIGPSWEGWCIEQICANLPSTADISFYRTSCPPQKFELVYSKGFR